MYKGKFVDTGEIVDCFVYEGRQDEESLKEFCNNTKFDVVRTGPTSATLKNKRTNCTDIIYCLTWLIKKPESNEVFLYDGHYDAKHKHLHQDGNIFYVFDDLYSIVFIDGKLTVVPDVDAMPENYEWIVLSKKKYKEYCDKKNIEYIEEERWQPKKNMDPGY